MTSRPQIVGSSPIRKEGRGQGPGPRPLRRRHHPPPTCGSEPPSAAPIPRGRITSPSPFDPAPSPGHEYTIVSAADIPGENTIVHLHKRPPLPRSLPRQSRRRAHPPPRSSQPGRTPCCRGRRPHHVRRAPRHLHHRRLRKGKSAIIWGEGEHANTFKTLPDAEGSKANPRRGLGDRRLHRGRRVPHRSPGAALHREQRSHSRILRRNRSHRPRFHAVPVLPSFTALELVFNLPAEKCRVIQTETGGSLRRQRGLPLRHRQPRRSPGDEVRAIPSNSAMTRAEDMAATTKRHPSRTRHRTAVSKDGKLLAGEIDFAIDGGAYATLSPVVPLPRHHPRPPAPTTGPISPSAPKQWQQIFRRTGPFRGFGAPQSIFALERHMDKIANVVGLTPEELRRRNFLGTGDHTATGTAPQKIP